MENVTIDNIGIQPHQKYAKDQALFDPSFLEASMKVSPHTEVTGTTSIFASQWAALFGLDLRYLPWAGFLPPPRFNTQSKRFFSYRVIPSLSFPEDTHERTPEEEEKKKRLKAFILRRHGNQIDTQVLFDLIETIFSLDDLLGKILVKKLQYHKG